MLRIPLNSAKAACILGVCLAAAACSTSRLHLSDNFGYAVRQEQVAQVADPDARYAGVPAPGSNGMRVGSAQARYEHGAVIPPTSMTTSNVSVGGGGGGSPGS